MAREDPFENPAEIKELEEPGKYYRGKYIPKHAKVKQKSLTRNIIENVIRLTCIIAVVSTLVVAALIIR